MLIVRYRLFIESQVFTKFVGDYLNDDEYLALQHYMLEHPKQGLLFVVPGVFASFDGTCEERARVAVYA